LFFVFFVLPSILHFSNVLLIFGWGDISCFLVGDTYAKISDEAESRWKLEMARMVLSMERSMSEEERIKQENQYWVLMDGKRYLQVEEEDFEHWGKAAETREAAAAAAGTAN
jgi:hypothetical protein